MDETTKGERRQRLKDRALVNAYVSGDRRQPRRAHCSDAQMALNILEPHQVFNLSNAVPVKTFHFFLFTCLSSLLNYELFKDWVVSCIHVSITSTSSYT